MKNEQQWIVDMVWAQLIMLLAHRQTGADRNGLYAGWNTYCANKLCRVWWRLLPPLTWLDRTVCVRAHALLLHINWGQWSQHAQHLKEETNCWKQAPHLDFLRPRFEPWPLPLLHFLLRSQICSRLPYPNKRAPGIFQAKSQRESLKRWKFLLQKGNLIFLLTCLIIGLFI